jgi:flavin-dependent dehydrogenase
METFDAIVVGGGPAGSTCAWQLVRSGARVAVIDRARFPRDKVCAGWITPSVVATLELDLAEYSAGRTLQPFQGFETALGVRTPKPTAFDRVISYGIRRVEFDAYLLARSGAQVFDGEPCETFERQDGRWTVNGRWAAPILVGAGGHFCPVARFLNAGEARPPTVVAKEVEFACPPDTAGSPVSAERPALFFEADLMGYGWCVRKGNYLNVGLGHLDPETGFAADVEAFRARLVAQGLVPAGAPTAWKGHAYLLANARRTRITGDGALLVGDAAGLALAPSGEGILAAVESGILAAEAVARLGEGRWADRLAGYEARINERFGPREDTPWLSRLPAAVRRAMGRTVLGVPALTRRLIEDGFLHSRRPPLGAPQGFSRP